MVKELDMRYEKIDACHNDCMLFYKEDQLKGHVTYAVKADLNRGKRV